MRVTSSSIKLQRTQVGALNYRPLMASSKGRVLIRSKYWSPFHSVVATLCSDTQGISPLAYSYRKPSGGSIDGTEEEMTASESTNHTLHTCITYSASLACSYLLTILLSLFLFQSTLISNDNVSSNTQSAYVSSTVLCRIDHYISYNSLKKTRFIHDLYTLYKPFTGIWLGSSRFRIAIRNHGQGRSLTYDSFFQLFTPKKFLSDTPQRRPGEAPNRVETRSFTHLL